MRRPHVIVLAPRRPGEGPGGAERHLADLGTVLESVGAQVTFLSAADAPPPNRGERVVARAMPLMGSALASRRIARAHLVNRADVLLTVELMGVGIVHPRHLHLFFGSYAGFRRAALGPTGRVRSVGRHTVSVIARMLERAAQGKSGAVANSLALQSALLAAGIPVRSEVIVPPVDTEAFVPQDRAAARRELGLPQEPRLLLFAGRWEYAKGADRLERLFEHLPAGWKVLLACPADASHPWPNSEVVLRLENIPHPQMPKVYAAADVLIQPSRFEGYSLVVSEAQACGRAVLSSPVGQGEHLRQGPPAVRVGVVEAPDQVDAWLEALSRIAGTAERSAHSGREARAFVERTASREVVSEQWGQLLAKLYPELAWQACR